MCLTEVKKLNVAKSDMVVWKHLRQVKLVRQDVDVENLDGKPFEGIIQGIKLKGKISIFKGEKGIYMYFCTESSRHNGERTPIRHGYNYSWVFDKYVSNFSVEISNLYFVKNDKKVRSICYYDTVCRYASVSGCFSGSECNRCKF